MESNKDEALKCLSIAQKHRNAGNLASAQRFCQKSLSLFSTPEGARLLEIVESEMASEPSSSTSASSSAGSSAGFSTSAETHPSSSGTRHRHTESGAKANGSANGSAKGGGSDAAEKKREYTPEQATVVKRIRACKVTEYYEILSLKRDCEEADIKKAYRKV
jgi:DnaJ homolog subfamily B member 12